MRRALADRRLLAGGYWAVMSQANVEAFQRAMEAANRRDIDSVLEELDPEVEWHAGFTAALVGEAGATYRGREGARRAMQELLDVFDQAHYDMSEIRDLGDLLLVLGRVRLHGAGSEVPVESPWAFLIRLKNGKAIWVRTYPHHEEALEAAGLRE